MLLYRLKIFICAGKNILLPTSMEVQQGSSVNNNLNNLRKILKYSDSEPLELVLAFVRMVIFPYLSIASLSLPWWLAVLSISVGLIHIYAVSERCITCRHKANFISFMTSLLICLIVGREYNLFHFQFVISFSVWCLTALVLLKTDFQIIKGGSNYGHK